jgi:anti-anti-sigma regulatory factor
VRRRAFIDDDISSCGGVRVRDGDEEDMTTGEARDAERVRCQARPIAERLGFVEGLPCSSLADTRVRFRGHEVPVCGKHRAIYEGWGEQAEANVERFWNWRATKDQSGLHLGPRGQVRPMDAPGPPIPANIRVRHGLGDSRRPITVIQAIGEHDYGSRALLARALEQVDGHVIVDLSSCTFIDTTVIGAITAKALALAKIGLRLELVVPPTAPFARTIERLQVGMLLPVLDTLPEDVSPS